jgi:hypothetical protein
MSQLYNYTSNYFDRKTLAQSNTTDEAARDSAESVTKTTTTVENYKDQGATAADENNIIAEHSTTIDTDYTVNDAITTGTTITTDSATATGNLTTPKPNETEFSSATESHSVMEDVFMLDASTEANTTADTTADASAEAN